MDRQASIYSYIIIIEVFMLAFVNTNNGFSIIYLLVVIIVAVQVMMVLLQRLSRWTGVVKRTLAVFSTLIHLTMS